MDDQILLELLVLLVLILINAFFASSELAIISLNDNKIRKMAEEGHKKARVLVNLIEEPSKFLATIQVGVTLSGFLASAFAADSFADRITVWALEKGIPVSESVIQTTSVIVITLLLSYMTLVFGELVPKRIAMQKPERIAFSVATPLKIIAFFAKPFVQLLSFSTNSIIRLFGIDPHAHEETITEEEIRMMVDVGEEKGVIQGNEKEMISNVLEFNDKTVEEVMVHRTNMAAVSIDAPMNEIIETILSVGHSRFPVYKDSVDNILGILHVKELLPYIIPHNNEEVDLVKLLRKAHFILESKTTSDAFAELQKHSTQIAIVVDEYGGTAGIFTMEDLVEEIVGDIQDEFDEIEEQEIVQIDDVTYHVLGNVPIKKIESHFKLTLDDNFDYDTIGGYMTGQLGRVVEDHEHPTMNIGQYSFQVLDASERRINKIKVTKHIVS